VPVARQELGAYRTQRNTKFVSLGFFQDSNDHPLVMEPFR
jgi:hypothetical protein